MTAFDAAQLKPVLLKWQLISFLAHATSLVASTLMTCDSHIQGVLITACTLKFLFLLIDTKN